MNNYKAVVIGASAGGFELLSALFAALPGTFPLPVFVVVHTASCGYSLAKALSKSSKLKIIEGIDKESIQPRQVIVAPGGYHMLVEEEGCISLCAGERVSHSIPSVDVLFKSAADVYGAGLIGVILSGANRDGTEGMMYLCEQGGTPVVQDPITAASPVMPGTVLKKCNVEHVIKPEDLPDFLVELVQKGR